MTAADCSVACDSSTGGISQITIAIINGFLPLEDSTFASTPTGYFYNAGKADETAGNYESLGKYWFVYDCSTSTMFIKALIGPKWTIEIVPGQNFVKTGLFT
eukprot:10191227-Ditylum_brightwellii.AAC.1